MQRALITGINGFTGYYLTKELVEAGWQVFGTGIEDRPNNPNYRKVNLNDLAGMCEWIKEVKPSVVVHFAGIAFVGHDDAGEIYDNNLKGTYNLLKALALAKLQYKCILLPSSATIYGNAVSGMLAENTPPNPANDYSVSKLAMEYMARLWFDKLPIVIARPFNYTGVGQSESFIIPKIVAHFRRREKVIELGNIDVWREWSDVRCVVRAYRRLLEVSPIGETINICSGHAVSLREVLGMMAEIADYEIEIRVNPAYVRDNEVIVLCGDPTKLHQLVGELPSISMIETLRWMMQEGK